MESYSGQRQSQQSVLSTIIEEIKIEKRGVGEIIDDRSLNRIPFMHYVGQYNILQSAVEHLQAAQKLLEEV
jgi:hypothetical protein